MGFSALTVGLVTRVIVRPKGKQGEFRVRAPHLTSGYFNAGGDRGRIPCDLVRTGNAGYRGESIYSFEVTGFGLSAVAGFPGAKWCSDHC